MKKVLGVKTVQWMLIKTALNLKGPELGTNKGFRSILINTTSPIPSLIYNSQLKFVFNNINNNLSN